jgi:hypothetical protein
MPSQCRTTVLPEQAITFLKSSILVGSLMIGQRGAAETRTFCAAMAAGSA